MNVIVNGKATQVPGPNLTWEEVSVLAHGKERPGLSVTWRVPGTRDAGMLSAGQSVPVTEGMVINAQMTGSA